MKQTAVITQYFRPRGNTILLTVEVDLTPNGAAVLPMMHLSCEVLRTGQVALYGRLAVEEDEDEIMLLASNDPTAAPAQQPNVILANIIERVAERTLLKAKAI